MVFRELRRKRQGLALEAAEDMLVEGRTGVLAVLGDDDYPYAVPLNYVYDDGAIFFHGARTGHKIDAIRGHGKVSFCVVAKDLTVPDLFASDYRSVIAFGRAREVDDDVEKLRIMRLLNEKYAPGLREEGEREITKDWKALCVVRMDVEHLSGKEAADSVKGRG